MQRLITLSLLMIITLAGLLPFQIHAQDGSSDVISAENVQDLVEIERFGYGTRDAFAWTADESHLAVGGSLGVWLYDGQNLEAEPRFLPNSPAHVHHLAFNGDATQIAIGWGINDEQGLFVLDVETGDIVLEWDDVVRGDPGLQFSADGSVFVAQTERGTVVWDMGEMLERYVLPTRGTVALSRDGRWLAVKESHLGMAVYDLQTGDSQTFSPSNFQEGGIMGPATGLVSVAFTEYEGQLVAATLHEERDQVDWLLVMRFWDISTGSVVYRSNVGSGLAPDYEFETISDAGIALQEAIDWKGVERHHTGRVGDVLPQPLLSFNPSFMGTNGELMAVAGRSTSRINLWNLNTGEHVMELRAEGGAVHALAMSNDGRVLVAGADETLNVWTFSGSIEHSFADSTLVDYISELSLTTDDRYVISSGLREVTEWSLSDPSAPSIVRQFPVEEPFVWEMDISPDGRYMAFKDHRVIRLIDLESGEEIRQFADSDMYLHQMMFSADGALIYGLTGTFDDTSEATLRPFLGYVVAWDVETGLFLGEISDESIHIDRFVQNSDGSLLVASASHDEDGAYIFDAASGEVLRELDTTGVPIFSADGSKFYLVDTGVMYVFGLPENE